MLTENLDLQGLATAFLDPAISPDLQALTHSGRLDVPEAVRALLERWVPPTGAPSRSVEPAPPASPMVAALAERFPGRSAFVEQLASALELFLRHFDLPRGASSASKPNILLLGREGVGKSYLLHTVLPAVVPDFLPGSERHGQRACVVSVDARHLAASAHRGDAFGPVHCARALVSLGDQDAETWAEMPPVVICLDHLESLWDPYEEKVVRVLSPEGIAATVARVVRGLRCSLPPSAAGEAGASGRDTGWMNTESVLFVASARLDRLRPAVEKRVGETGACVLEPSMLVEAGMPADLAHAFPLLLTVPPLRADDYREAIRAQRHPAFAWLVEGGHDRELHEILFRHTWRGSCDFPLLARLLALLALEGSSPSSPSFAGSGEVRSAVAATAATAALEQGLLRHEIGPGDLSRRSAAEGTPSVCNLHLLFRRSGEDGAYRVEATGPLAAGKGSVQVYPSPELRTALDAYQDTTWQQSSDGALHLSGGEPALDLLVLLLGRLLWRDLFSDGDRPNSLGRSLLAALAARESREHGLRIFLHFAGLGDDILARAPWNALLYSASGDDPAFRALAA
ncbi:MAG: hypothetical protein MI919_32365, partial [Holophagales bacterium]|nr:hypothetical protein [Holophagales bacterium]